MSLQRPFRFRTIPTAERTRTVSTIVVTALLLSVIRTGGPPVPTAAPRPHSPVAATLSGDTCSSTGTPWLDVGVVDHEVALLVVVGRSVHKVASSTEGVQPAGESGSWQNRHIIEHLLLSLTSCPTARGDQN